MIIWYGNICLKCLLVQILWICLFGPIALRETTRPCVHVPLYVDALIPVNSEGWPDYVRNAMSASAFQPWLQQKPQISDITSKTMIRIARTEESQLSDIASFLATSSQMSDTGTSNPWKDRIDLLFAKSDIEVLIRRRWRILKIGQKAFELTKKQLQEYSRQQQQQHKETNVAMSHRQNVRWHKNSMQLDDKAVLEYLWSTHDELRTEIQIAASETGEDTIWKHHYPIIITPSSKQWFNHIQLSAISTCRTNGSVMASVTKTSSAFLFPFNLKTADIKDDPTSKAVGFCEVAMLSNPTYSANQTLDDCHDRIANDCVISIQDRKQLCMDGTPQINFYSPAIANLAVDPTMRRQGIATKLLKSAERYISQYWVNATTMGLYVSTSNTPAIRLYEKCGYHKQMTVSSTALSSSADNDVARRLSDTANGGSMWYMSKEI